MCGIVGTVGESKLRNYLIEGLKSLEYRGYDSSGTAFLTNQKLEVFRLPGRIDDLNRVLDDKAFALKNKEATLVDAESELIKLRA